MDLLTNTKAARSRIHKSSWRCIKILGDNGDPFKEIEFMLDDTGRLIDKFPKHKPRKYLPDLKVYQNDESNSTKKEESSSSSNDPALHQEYDFDCFSSEVVDQDFQTDCFFNFELDDNFIDFSL